MSRYTQRCTACRQVRGVSAFRVEPQGGRATACRWCEMRTVNETEAERARLRNTMNAFARREGQLLRQLADVREKLAKAREAFASHDLRTSPRYRADNPKVA